jgi:hypothetical protein
VDEYTLSVTRVAFRFYVWVLRLGDSVTIGSGTKAGARAAVARFIAKNGGGPVAVR